MASKMVFVDTSAFYALMDRSDLNYKQASRLWAALLEENCYLYTGNYIVVETMALLQNRLGFEAANLRHRDVLGLAEVLWVDKAIHNHSYELRLGLGLFNCS